MISLKYAVVILTFASYSVATVLLSSPDPYVDGLHLLKDPDHKKEHWDMVKSSLDEMFPGVTCRVHTDNSTIQSPPNLITLSIESALMDIHPSISCTGELDEGVFLGGFDKGSHVLEKRSEVPMCKPCCCKECPKQEYHAAQAAAPHYYTKTAQDVQSEVKAQNAVGIEETKSGYVSCQQANHPDACIACWTGFATQLASELGICSTAGYVAMLKLNAGNFSPGSPTAAGIWLVFMCCVGACTGKFVALSSGCLGR